MTLFVRNIGYDCKEEDLKEFFEQFGEVKEIKLVKGDGDTHKGCGFVKMGSVEAVDKAESISKAYWDEKMRFMDKAEA